MPQTMLPLITKDYILEWAANQRRGTEKEWLEAKIASGEIKLVPVPDDDDPRVTWYD